MMGDSKMRIFLQAAALGAVATMALAGAAPARAELVNVTLTVQNIAPLQSVAVSALSFAFHGGVYDPFDAGAAPGAPIIPVAELGSGVDWLPAFLAADPTAVVGVSPGPLTPGAFGTTATFLIDTDVNPYFSFGAMVVPSNDHFIGNDDPAGYRLFDTDGNALITQINFTAADIWDAGSELFNVANAAFIEGSDPTQRIEEGGVVTPDFAEFANFAGLTTAAGYTFVPALQPDTAIYRIDFTITPAAVPEPATWAMMIAGLGLAGAALRWRGARAQGARAA